MLQATRAMAGVLMLLPICSIAWGQASDGQKSAAELKASVSKPTDGRATQDIWVGDQYTVLTSLRLVPGEVEVHTKRADVFVVQEGRATILLGGTVEGGHETASNELRGGRIIGGHERTVNPGDVLWIPAGEPHQVTPLGEGAFRYLVVKVDSSGTTASQTPPPAAQVDVAEPIATLAFLEGPVATDEGDLYFTDLQNNRIWKRSSTGTLAVFRSSANYANGLALDDRGRLLAAENGDPAADTPARITRTDLATGHVEVLVSRFDGKAFNGPNDLVVDGKGRIYFTDWARPDFLPPAPLAASNPFAVYRVDTNGSIHQLLVAPQVQAPNGVMVAPDDRTLYLVESNKAAGGSRRIVAYPLQPDGSLGTGSVFHEFSPGRSGDGMAVDTVGNLWVAAGLNAPRPGGETMDTKAGIYVFAPDGRQLRMIPIPEDLVTNVAFGGPQRRTAFIVAGKTLYRARSEIDGTRR